MATQHRYGYQGREDAGGVYSCSRMNAWIFSYLLPLQPLLLLLQEVFLSVQTLFLGLLLGLSLSLLSLESIQITMWYALPLQRKIKKHTFPICFWNTFTRGQHVYTRVWFHVITRCFTGCHMLSHKLHNKIT